MKCKHDTDYRNRYSTSTIRLDASDATISPFLRISCACLHMFLLHTQLRVVDIHQFYRIFPASWIKLFQPNSLFSALRYRTMSQSFLRQTFHDAVSELFTQNNRIVSHVNIRLSKQLEAITVSRDSTFGWIRDLYLFLCRPSPTLLFFCEANFPSTVS